MRILVTSQYFWPESFVINDLVPLLSDLGHDVTVLTGKPNYPEGRFYKGYGAQGITREDFGAASVIRVPMLARGRSKTGLALNYVSFILSASLFGPWVTRGKSFDVVFVYGLSPLLQALPSILLARLRGLPMVIWVQDLWPESLSATGHVRNRLVLRLVSTLVRLIYRSSDRILVQSQAFFEPVAKYADKDRIHYYPNPYLEKQPGEASERAVALGDDMRRQFSVVFAGNLGTAQALDTLVDAAKLLRERSDICFFVVGSGSREEHLREEVRLNGLDNVKFCGRFDSQEMGTILSAASALLVSLTDAPIFALTVPSKLQGYLAGGRPVLAAINGEGGRIVEEAGAGLVSPAEDAAALAEAVEKLAALPEAERKAMGDRGRAYFEKNFSANKLAEALAWHLEQVTNQMSVTK
jgi:glycosyltransferase involved in cell wall biosynthesis